MMISLEEFRTLINTRVHNILNNAEMALPKSQFAAFRKSVLDELGNNGLISDLEKAITHSKTTRQRSGAGRNILRKKGGV